jgi:hypothetical protein
LAGYRDDANPDAAQLPLSAYVRFGRKLSRERVLLLDIGQQRRWSRVGST